MTRTWHLLPFLFLFWACQQIPPTPLSTATPPPTAVPTATRPPLPTPVPAVPPGRLAFIDPDGRLGTINAAGQELRWLTAEGESYQFPAWSATTNQIAVIGGELGDGGVYVVTDEETAALTKLYDKTSPIYLYWSPDGRLVSFIARFRNSLELYTAPADGSVAAAQLATGNPIYWQWAADSQQMLTHRTYAELSWIDLTGQETQLDTQANGVFQTPALSHDGQFLAYSQANEGSQQLAVRDMLTQSSVYTATHSASIAVGWSPTRPVLAYTLPGEESFSFFGPLFLYDAESQIAQQVVQDEVFAFFWSPNGRYLAYLAPPFVGQTAKTERAKPALQDQFQLTLYILDTENKGIRPVYTFPVSLLFLSQFLPFFDQYAHSHRLWSPESTHLVLPIAQEDGPDHLMLIPVDGQPATFITEGVSAFWSYR